MYEEADYLQLSGVQHFSFCRRQWALIHIEQQWAENERTTAGELFHKRAHDEGLTEKRGSKLIVRGMKIASSRLGISGNCDVVEFHSVSDGIQIKKYDGLWKAVPVEYKKGIEKNGQEDMIQLCAQAICLEEMLLTEIPYGYLYYGESKKRVKVIFDNELRNEVIALCKEMHQYFAKDYTPKSKRTKKCNACSLKDICIPKLEKIKSVKTYMKTMLEET